MKEGCFAYCFLIAIMAFVCTSFIGCATKNSADFASAIPPNAMQYDNTWFCMEGYKLNTTYNGCAKMTSEETQRLSQLSQKMRDENNRIYCQRAYNRCVSMCQYSSFDNEQSKSLLNTDVNSMCENACISGKSSCEDKERIEQCSEFKRGCKSLCSSEVYNYSSGEHVFSSRANAFCENACNLGERVCRNY